MKSFVMQFVPCNLFYILSLDSTKMANEKSSNPHEFKPFLLCAHNFFSVAKNKKLYTLLFSTFNSLSRAIEYWYHHSYGEPFHCFFSGSEACSPALSRSYKRHGGCVGKWE
jgi:hypothetical protein